MSPKQPQTVFHAFNWLLKDIQTHQGGNFIRNLSQDGFDAIQISPVQECIESSREWYYRYQPKDHLKINGLGNTDDLVNLCKAAKNEKMMIIADVVFNHMAVLFENDVWRKADEKRRNGEPDELFNLYEQAANQLPHLTISDIREWHSMDHGREWDEAPYRIIGYGNDEWIDLRPTRNVIEVHKKHLKLLMDSGVRGFRFDAIKHMAPWHFKTYVNYIKSICPEAWIYGEVLSQDESMHKEYQWIAPSTDFHLTQQIHDAFSFGGNLNKLAMPKVLGHFTTRFVRNHDTIKNDGFENFKFSNNIDAQLAWAYLLSISHGTTLVFDMDYENSYFDTDCVRYGAQFRSEMNRRFINNHYILNNNSITGDYNSNLMFIQRDEQGIVIINKSNVKLDYPVADFSESMLYGEYEDLQYKTKIKIENDHNGRKFITQWGGPNRGGIEIGPRTALFFKKI